MLEPSWTRFAHGGSCPSALVINFGVVCRHHRRGLMRLSKGEVWYRHLRPAVLVERLIEYDSGIQSVHCDRLRTTPRPGFGMKWFTAAPPGQGGPP